MLLPTTNHLVIHQEKLNDQLRKIERQRWLQDVAPQPGLAIKKHRQVLTWLGAKMVQWGLKIQSYGTASPLNRVAVKSAK